MYTQGDNSNREMKTYRENAESGENSAKLEQKQKYLKIAQSRKIVTKSRKIDESGEK